MTKELSQLGAHFTLAEAARVGLTASDLGDLIDQGEVFQREPGERYARAGSPSALWLDIWDATTALKGSVACLETALAWYGLAPEIPKRTQIAVPRGSATEANFRLPVEVFEYDPDTFDVGAGLVEVNRGCDAPIYTDHRAVADVITRRDLVSEERAREIVRRYKPRADSHMTHTARLLGVESQVAEFLASTT
ncbi:hypothetical protein [Allokutzneria multivorans]|uniref:type IV toxin-antitoxin system AbiEi family antitoxin domain-containing protein n=1 Tax=Allokutzneria multivorans TaxID=1142134 RepID=UPI0031ED2915